jgi:hypothetical protein
LFYREPKHNADGIKSQGVYTKKTRLEDLLQGEGENYHRGQPWSVAFERNFEGSCSSKVRAVLRIEVPQAEGMNNPRQTRYPKTPMTLIFNRPTPANGVLRCLHSRSEAGDVVDDFLACARVSLPLMGDHPQGFQVCPVVDLPKLRHCTGVADQPTFTFFNPPMSLTDGLSEIVVDNEATMTISPTFMTLASNALFGDIYCVPFRHERQLEAV